MLEIVCSIILMPLAIGCGLLSVVMVGACVTGLLKSKKTKKSSSNLDNE